MKEILLTLHILYFVHIFFKPGLNIKKAAKCKKYFFMANKFKKVKWQS
jgi:hypothetical protein